MYSSLYFRKTLSYSFHSLKGFKISATSLLYNFYNLLVRCQAFILEGGVLQESFQDYFIKNHSDTSDDGVSICDNVISNRENEISSACGDVACKCKDFQVVFSCEGEYFIANDFALYGEPSRGINRNC